MVIFYWIYLLSFLLKCFHFSKIIDIPLIKSADIYDVILNISNSRLTLEFELDMSIDFLWVHLLRFNLDEIEMTNELAKFKVDGTLTVFNLIKANFQFSPEVILNNFVFFHRVNKELAGYDSFPLGYTIHNESLSIIHSLYNNHYIDHKIFSVVYKDNGTLFLGGLPDNITQDLPYNKSCQVIENKDTWGCQMNFVIFGDFIYNNDNYSYFQTNKHEILCPQNFINFLEKNLFKEFLDAKICTFHHESSINFFDCTSIPKNFPNFKFIFGKINLEIESDKLFVQKGDDFDFLIKFNIYNANEWILGDVFLRKYITLFDYANSKINFYSNTSLFYDVSEFNKKANNYLIQQFVIIINYLTLLIFTFLLIYMYFTEVSNKTNSANDFNIFLFGK